ncbi:putative ferric enterobactin uptake receptor [Helicobacter fennelliae]|uniref:Putative ferric enterobactin uptake receptor n=3 Tax=Helicobacter TaxID=209 RepID=A0A2X3BFP6_9HELI|nr:TonB-dependent receptor plug domain-containing protein [Helicobacter fennelliae]SQB99463.1 putative ferric enterobactin uptake receptor [Helicobacter fennelliae]
MIKKKSILTLIFSSLLLSNLNAEIQNNELQNKEISNRGGAEQSPKNEGSDNLTNQTAQDSNQDSGMQDSTKEDSSTSSQAQTQTPTSTQNQAPISSQTTSSQPTSQGIETRELGRQVVSASGYAQDIKDAPASISVISKEELETKPYRDLGEAVADIPGVDIQRGKTGGFTISMRGFESKYTLFLVDGKRQNPSDGFNLNGFDAVNTSFMPPISMIERIEVIRRPASTLYGSDAIGGVINVITKKNPDKLAGSISLDSIFQEDRITWGNSHSVNGYLAVPIIKNTLSLSVRGKVYSKESSFLQLPNGSAQGNTAGLYDIYNLGGRLNYTINNKNNLYLDGEYYLQKASGSSLYGQATTDTSSVQSDYVRIKSTFLAFCSLNLAERSLYCWAMLSPSPFSKSFGVINLAKKFGASCSC